MNMSVRILFFARAKELAGVEQTELEMPAGSLLRHLRQELARRFPALADFLPRCQWAIDDILADEHTPISDGATIAILPPVSGGAR